MSNSIIQVDIAEILKEIQTDQKTILKEITDLKVGQAYLTGKVNNIEKTVTELKDTQKTLVSDIADLKGAKSLIVPIIVAVTVSILTLVIRTIPIG